MELKLLDVDEPENRIAIRYHAYLSETIPSIDEMRQMWEDLGPICNTFPNVYLTVRRV